jgi:hypothetical protein
VKLGTKPPERLTFLHLRRDLPLQLRIIGASIMRHLWATNALRMCTHRSRIVFPRP